MGFLDKNRIYPSAHLCPPPQVPTQVPPLYRPPGKEWGRPGLWAWRALLSVFEMVSFHPHPILLGGALSMRKQRHR